MLWHVSFFFFTDVDNADFYHGFAEKEINKLIPGLDESENIVAVLNPGRGGLGEWLIGLWGI